MIEFIPYVFAITLSLTIGLVSISLYRKSGKSGLALISFGFFLNAIPSAVNLAMGGPYLALRLMDQGYTTDEIGAIYSYLYLFGGAIQIVFAIVVIVGLVKLAKQQRNDSAEFAA